MKKMNPKGSCSTSSALKMLRAPEFDCVAANSCNWCTLAANRGHCLWLTLLTVNKTNLLKMRIKSEFCDLKWKWVSKNDAKPAIKQLSASKVLTELCTIRGRQHADYLLWSSVSVFVVFYALPVTWKLDEGVTGHRSWQGALSLHLSTTLHDYAYINSALHVMH